MTSKKCRCTAKIQDPKRATFWSGIFPNDEIPVVGKFLLQRKEFESIQGVVVDLSRVRGSQLRKIVSRISEREGIMEKEARRIVETQGILLEKDGLTINRCEIHSFVEKLSKLLPNQFAV